MKIRFLRIANFRGFELLELKPDGHVLLVGEPGAGRTDLVEALWRVLSPESSRFLLSEDLDFHDRDLASSSTSASSLGTMTQTVLSPSESSGIPR